MTETLSKKRIIIEGMDYPDFINTEDVKQFIKDLKEEYLKLITRVFNHTDDQDVLDLIDKLAGEELTK